ncbi:hypothetical protein FS837_003661 [Tulasnella sp. UAMH 9824]|nr:hypothetical protein FS837_003661 [Tulasnella sp. UAMH 9824]
MAELKAGATTTGAPVLNAPGPNYLPPMPERPATESATTSQRPHRQPASLGTPQWVPPSAAKTSKVQRPPSPDDAMRFPTPKMPQPSASRRPQPSFAGGFAVSMYDSPDGPAATSAASPYPTHPAMREPGFR